MARFDSVIPIDLSTIKRLITLTSLPRHFPHVCSRLLPNKKKRKEEEDDEKSQQSLEESEGNEVFFFFFFSCPLPSLVLSLGDCIIIIVIVSIRRIIACRSPSLAVNEGTAAFAPICQPNLCC